MSKFTYFLEIDKEDDQMRVIQTIDQVHLHPGDGRGRNKMIRLDILKHLTKLTYALGRRMIRLDILKQITKITYILETGERDAIG